MAYSYRKRKSNIGFIIICCVLAIVFISISAVLFKNNQTKAVKLKEITKEVATLEASRSDLEVKVEACEVQNKQLTKRVEQLKGEVNALKSQGITIDLDREVESKKTAYLTFDDGPSKNTLKILDFLKANKIKATFFVLGNETQGDIYRRIVDEGHTIAIHSNKHEYSQIYQTVDTFMTDVNEVSSIIEKETGVKPDVLRFPGGSNNTVSHQYGGTDIMDKIIPQVKNQGYTYFDWNVDSMDAAKGLQDKEVIVESVLNGSKHTDNAIILMHDAGAKTTTVDALPQIIEGLKEQGFVFDKLTPESPGMRFKE